MNLYEALTQVGVSVYGEDKELEEFKKKKEFLDRKYSKLLASELAKKTGLKIKIDKKDLIHIYSPKGGVDFSFIFLDVRVQIGGNYFAVGKPPNQNNNNLVELASDIANGFKKNYFKELENLYN